MGTNEPRLAVEQPSASPSKKSCERHRPVWWRTRFNKKPEHSFTTYFLTEAMVRRGTNVVRVGLASEASLYMVAGLTVLAATVVRVTLSEP